MDIRRISGYPEPVFLTRLQNGFTLIHVQRPSQMAYARITVAVGSLDDDLPGEAHFLEHLLAAGSHRGGCHPRLARLKKDVGVLEYEATTGWDSTMYEARTWRTHARELVETLGDVAFRPQFDDDAVSKEIGVIHGEIYLKLGRILFDRRARARLLANHPAFHHHPVGYIETVSAMTNERLQSTHKRRYATRRSMLLTVGDIDLQDVASWINPYLESLEEGRETDRVRAAVTAHDVTGVIDMSDPYLRDQYLIIGYPGTVEGKTRTMEKMWRMFFDEPDFGILTNELRHKRSLLYHLAFGNGTWPLVTGSLVLDGYSPTKEQEILDIAIETMFEADERTFSGERLEWVKNHLLMELAEESEERVSIGGLASYWLMDILGFNAEVEAGLVRDTTPEQLRSFHEQHWNPETLCILKHRPA